MIEPTHLIALERITAKETNAIRHQVLRPNESVEYYTLADDGGAFHFGRYVDHQVVCLVSLS